MADSNLKLATNVAISLNFNLTKSQHGIAHSSRPINFQNHASQAFGATHIRSLLKFHSTAAMADSNLILATIVTLTIYRNCAKFQQPIAHSSRAMYFKTHASQAL